jgi:hypothetical protein
MLAEISPCSWSLISSGKRKNYFLENDYQGAKRAQVPQYPSLAHTTVLHIFLGKVARSAEIGTGN